VNDLYFLFLLLLVFASVFMLVWSVFRFPVRSEVPTTRRIAESTGQFERSTPFEVPLLAPLLAAATQIARRISVPPLRERIRKDLDASGNPNAYTVDEVLALSLVLALTTAIVGGAVVLALGGGLFIIMLAIGVGCAFYGPIFALRGAADARKMRIAKQLPYTLDLVALMLEAGSTFTEAVDVMVRDDPEEDFNQELRIVRAEIDFGTRRNQALAHMSERIPLDSLRSVVGAVNQAETLGTPLSSILKSQASVMRLHRSVRAEKVSASASLRILIPSLLILLAAILVVLGPLFLLWWSQSQGVLG